MKNRIINKDFHYVNALLRFIPEDILDESSGKMTPFKIWKHQNRIYAGFPPSIIGQTSDEESNDIIEPLEKLIDKLKTQKK